MTATHYYGIFVAIAFVICIPVYLTIRASTKRLQEEISDRRR